MIPSRPTASIIVPTFAEAANVKTLVQRVFQAVDGAGIEAELLIVDDNSQDGTEEIIASLTQQHPVRLIVRRNERGLSSAVLAGFAEARFDRFVVLDADLQHPPELIPEILSKLDQDGCDFVIGTRYGTSGNIEKDWPFVRRLTSTVATLLARPLVPLSDPMSGFFAIHRRSWERADRLNPIGYKIALELFVKARCHRPAEVPIHFSARTAGQSKLNLAEQWRFLRHLARLYRFRYPKLTGLVLLGVVLGIAAAAYVIL